MPEFAVWAPRPETVRLEVDGVVSPMTRGDDGWWRATVDAAPDARYGFLLDDDPTLLPDPRSPRQPDGVHEPPSCGSLGNCSMWSGPAGRCRAR